MASYYIDSLYPASVARMLVCRECQTCIASMEDFLSRAFRGAQCSRAGLFDHVSNTTMGAPQVWLMSSGAHTIRELACGGCGAYVGWQIVRAHEMPERWKNGAFVLERDFLMGRDVFEDWSPASRAVVEGREVSPKLPSKENFHDRNLSFSQIGHAQGIYRRRTQLGMTVQSLT